MTDSLCKVLVVTYLVSHSVDLIQHLLFLSHVFIFKVSPYTESRRWFKVNLSRD